MGLSLQTPLCQLQPATTLGVILLRKTHVSILAPNEDRKHSAKLPKKLKWFYLFILVHIRNWSSNRLRREKSLNVVAG